MALLPDLFLDRPAASSTPGGDCDADTENHNQNNDGPKRLDSTPGVGGAPATPIRQKEHKRKALGALSQGRTAVQNEPAAKRRRTQHEDKKGRDAAAAPKWRSTAASPPQPGSLQDIIRRHPRTRLFVPPGLWTGLHLDLIGASFVDVAPPQDHEDIIDNTTPHATALQRRALSGLRRTYNTIHLVALDLGLMLSPWEFRPTGPWTYSDLKLPFSFGQTTCWLPVRGLLHHPDNVLPTSPQLPPSVAIVDTLAVAGSARYPSSSIYLPRYPQVPPPRSRREPYVLAVLIALAAALAAAAAEQQQQQGPETVALEEPPPIQVYAMDVARDNEKPGVWIYAADITPAFLARFEHPSLCAPATDPLEIRRTWLRYDSKIGDFLDGLHAALMSHTT